MSYNFYVKLDKKSKKIAILGLNLSQIPHNFVEKQGIMARLGSICRFIMLWVCLSVQVLKGQERIYLGYTSWWYPSLDYYNLKKEEGGKSRQFSGFGMSIPANMSILGTLLYGKSRFFLAESFDFTVRFGIGKTHKIEPGVDEKATDGMIGLGMNLGIAAAYEFDDLAIGARWIFWGGDLFTNFDYDISGSNRNMLETRVKVGQIMAQFAYAFNPKEYKNWNTMLCYFFQHDPEDRASNMYLFLKLEQKKNKTTTDFMKALVLSAGIGINIF